MSETYEPGELFVYMNGDRWELGEVKSANNNGDGYFCWYSTGDTAANTPTRCMHKLANAGRSHVEATLGSDLKAENAKLRELVRDYIDAPCTTCDCWQDEFRCWNYDGADCGLVARARELGVDE